MLALNVSVWHSAGSNVRLLDVKFGGILDDDDAILFRNKVGQYPQECGLAGPGSTTDKQCLTAANLFRQEVRKRPRQRAASDQIINCVMAAGEFPDCECWSTAHNRRNHCRQAASVRELCVQKWIVLVELLAELIGDHFEAGSELAGVEGNGLLLGT